MEKDPKGGFKCFGEYLSRVRRACVEGIRDSRLKTAGHMAEGSDAQGGFLCPEEWAAGIYNIALENSIVRPRAKVLQMSSDSLKIRRLVESSRVSSYFGGITFTWKYEGGDKSLVISKPALGELELTVHKLVGSLFASNELVADYPNFGEFMQLSFGQALAFEEDYYYVWGTGTGQPLGIMNAPATIAHARTAWPGTPVPADIAQMAGRLLPDSWKRAVWLINPTVLANWANDATAGSNAYGIIDLADMTCMGCPIIPTEKCSAAGTTGDIILADWNHYVIGNRSLEISASREVPGSYGFLTDETFWRVVLRVDGQPIMDAPVTPRLGGETVSAFVVLTTSS
jgi:HK97 family phage major capsid protein